MRKALELLFAASLAASCGSAADPAFTTEPTEPPTETDSRSDVSAEKGPGGCGFDRSDPEAGIANIMAAFATDEATATCIHEAWGDVANVAPAELTPELMVYQICGTSIFQMMTGDPRFTNVDE